MFYSVNTEANRNMVKCVQLSFVHIIFSGIYRYCMYSKQYTNDTWIFLSGLMPQTSYTFHVYGRNDRGQGKNSAGFTAQTEGEFWIISLGIKKIL